MKVKTRNERTKDCSSTNRTKMDVGSVIDEQRYYRRCSSLEMHAVTWSDVAQRRAAYKLVIDQQIKGDKVKEENLPERHGGRV